MKALQSLSNKAVAWFKQPAQSPVSPPPVQNGAENHVAASGSKPLGYIQADFVTAGENVANIDTLVVKNTVSSPQKCCSATFLKWTGRLSTERN